ncbi:MAG: serine hydrolase [Gemmataceae bacterium]
MKRLLALCLCSLLLIPRLSAQDARYEKAVAALDAFIARELKDKHIPALSIALVDDQTVVWAKGFGFQDPDTKLAATPRTVYRVGSVSKPTAALLLMMLVEMGLIDLDVPVQTYVPDFKPKNTSGKAITLRQIVSHRSGLVRESPVGSYFDGSEPSLEATALSLNGLELVYPPETKTSYSNVAVGLEGLVMQRTQKEEFTKLIRRKLLNPIGMTSSGYAITPELKKNLAKATMWTYHGREFPAPPFKMAMLSAGNLYSTVEDEAKLLSFLFAGGKTKDGKQLLRPETLEKMYQIQFAKKDDTAGFGIGWFISELDGKKRIGHGGAVYGFATEFAALPGEKLGVIVCASRDVANGLTRRLADLALRHMLAVKAGKDLPKIEKTAPLNREEIERLAGRYVFGKKGIDLIPSGEHLYLLPTLGGARVELRKEGKGFIVDDVQSFGLRLTPKDGDLVIDKDRYKRVAPAKPKPCPEKYRELLGEYGPAHNTLVLFERDGKLCALIEWVFVYPLEEAGKDVYRFPDFGLYHGDKVVIHRDAAGKVAKVTAGNVDFQPHAKETGTFRIRPLRPVAELEKEARKATPPMEKNPFFKKADLVDLTTLDKTIELDIRYACDNNFLGAPLYKSARAFMQRPAAAALVRAHQKLKEKGFGLLIHDAYRPWYVTKIFWDATPEVMKNFVADPLAGSRHNRGCAVDVTLYDLKTGKAVDMVSGYDEFTDRAYPDYIGGTSLERRHRAILREAMEAEGFTVYAAEWWHFDYRDWRHYPLGNVAFEELER